MGVLKDRMETDMKLRNLRPATQVLYLACAKKLAQHYHCSPAELGEEHVRRFLLYLREDLGRSPSTVKVYSAAMKFLYEKTLGRPEVVASLGWPKIEQELPEVLKRQ